MRRLVEVRDYLVVGLDDAMRLQQVVVTGARNAAEAAIRSGLDALDEIELGSPGWEEEWPEPPHLSCLLTDDIPF